MGESVRTRCDACLHVYDVADSCSVLRRGSVVHYGLRCPECGLKTCWRTGCATSKKSRRVLSKVERAIAARVSDCRRRDRRNARRSMRKILASNRIALHDADDAEQTT